MRLRALASIVVEEAERLEQCMHFSARMGQGQWPMRGSWQLKSFLSSCHKSWRRHQEACKGRSTLLLIAIENANRLEHQQRAQG
eukprot:1157262-Pelagomonas_calceolata.AAC.5